MSRKAENSLDTLGSTATLVVIPLSKVVAWSSLGCLRCSAFTIDAPFQRQRNVFVANHRNENGSALSILGIFLLSTQAGTRRHMVNIYVNIVLDWPGQSWFKIDWRQVAGHWS